MALAHELIEANAEERPVSRFSRRPVVIAVCVGLALLSLAAWSLFRSAEQTERKREEKVRVELAPDRVSAKELESAVDAKRIVLPDAEGAAPSASVASNTEARGKQQNLGVTEGVPQLPPDAYHGGGGAALARVSGPTFVETAREQLEVHALELQKWQLDLRKTAYASTSSAPAFAELKRQQQDFSRSLATEGEGDEMGALGGGLAMLAARASQMGSGPGAGGSGAFSGGVTDSPTALGTDPNMQQDKLRFFQQGGQQLEPGRLDSRVRAPASPFALLMGSVIPGVLISGIHSESPGQIIGQVSENVYDSATGRHLLIPQGSRLVGTYSAFIAQGQSRVQVAWVRLNFPDGSTMDLEGMPGTDQGGTAGFEDKVNRHFAKRLAAALMTTSLTVAYEVTQPQNGQLVEGAVHRGVGESLVQLGADMARQEGQLPPTLQIRAGYRFSIAVNKDMTFSGPYEDGIDRRVRR